MQVDRSNPGTYGVFDRHLNKSQHDTLFTIQYHSDSCETFFILLYKTQTLSRYQHKKHLIVSCLATKYYCRWPHRIYQHLL